MLCRFEAVTRKHSNSNNSNKNGIVAIKLVFNFLSFINFVILHFSIFSFGHSSLSPYHVVSFCHDTFFIQLFQYYTFPSYNSCIDIIFFIYPITPHITKFQSLIQWTKKYFQTSSAILNNFVIWATNELYLP